MCFKLNIVSVHRNVFFNNIKYVRFQGEQGNFSVYPKHSYLFTLIKYRSLLTVIQNNKFHEYFYVLGGITEIQPNYVNVISNYFINIKNLNIKSLISKKNIIEDKFKENKIKKESNIYIEYQKILDKIKFLKSIKNLY